jgi:hypothetical protein
LGCTEVLVEDTEGDDQKGGEKEGTGGGDVPLGEDDASVDGVPCHCVWGRGDHDIGIGKLPEHGSSFGILSRWLWSMVKFDRVTKTVKQTG